MQITLQKCMVCDSSTCHCELKKLKVRQNILAKKEMYRNYICVCSCFVTELRDRIFTLDTGYGYLWEAYCILLLYYGSPFSLVFWKNECWTLLAFSCNYVMKLLCNVSGSEPVHNFHSYVWHLLPFPGRTRLHSLWLLRYQLWICVRGKCPW